LLWNDREIGGYIIFFSEQRLGKQFPAATVTHATGKKGVAYAVRAEELKRRELGQPVQLSFTREAEERRRYG
jgi:hypothetical protein